MRWSPLDCLVGQSIWACGFVAFEGSDLGLKGDEVLEEVGDF